MFSTRTGYDESDDRISKTTAKKDELFTVLLVPAVPLHNDESELQAHVSARRRDVSFHSRSVRGIRAMGIFTTFVQTAKYLDVCAYAYLRDRFSHRHGLPALAQTIKAAAKASSARMAIA